MENSLCEQGLGVIIVLKIKFGLSLRTFETSGKPNVTLWIVLIHHKNVDGKDPKFSISTAPKNILARQNDGDSKL